VKETQRADNTSVYYIVNWPYHEHRHMGRAKSIRWVKAKIDYGLDGDWAMLANVPKPATPMGVFGLWGVCRGLAALSPYRGLILTNSCNPTPFTIEKLAQLTYTPPETTRVTICFLIATLGWIGLQQNCNSFAKLSDHLWRKRFTCKGKRLIDIGAKKARIARQKGADCAPKRRPTIQYRTIQNNTEQDNTDDWGVLHDLGFRIFSTGFEANLRESLKYHDREHVREAMLKAEHAGARSWAYVDGVLRNWEHDGYPEQRRKPEPDAKTKRDDEIVARIRREADIGAKKRPADAGGTRTASAPADGADGPLRPLLGHTEKEEDIPDD